MIGIREMFSELDGYDRYDLAVVTWAYERRKYLREYQREWYANNRSHVLSYLKAWRAQKRAKLGLPPRRVAQHGTAAKYSGGCRCGACRAASAEYRRKRRAELKEAA